MTRHAIVLTIAAAAAGAALPASAAEVQIAVQGPVVELTVNEIVQRTPDVAQVGAGVTTRAATAAEAMRQNAVAMDRLVAKLKAMGVAGKDIQTSNFSLNPQYQYRNDNQPPVFIGYDVSNQVSVKLRDIGRIGDVLDALVTSGANNLFGPNFMLEKDAEAKAEARTKAFASGKAMATEYARMAGYNGVRLLEVSETYQNYGGGPGPIIVTAVSRDAASPATKIEAGEVGTGVTMTVKYEMTR